MPYTFLLFIIVVMLERQYISRFNVIILHYYFQRNNTLGSNQAISFTLSVAVSLDIILNSQNSKQPPQDKCCTIFVMLK